MDLGLQGKVALVAASSQGLGRAIAEELGAEGAQLVLCARGEAALARTRDEIAAATGAEVVAVMADLAERSCVAKVTDTALDRFGRVDILVTNVGGPAPGRFESLSADDWHLAVRQNLDSVVELTRAVLPGMKERGFGRVLNVTSIAVKQPVDDLMLSNSIRAAVTGFARTLANEVAAFGITVNNILPGYTRTRRLDQLAEKLAAAGARSPDDVRGDWERQIPAGRLGEPREFAALAAFLASERASYITGTSIPVDGGWTRSLL